MMLFFKWDFYFWRSRLIFCTIKIFGLFLHGCWEFTSNMCVFPSSKYFKLYMERRYNPPIPIHVLWKNIKPTDVLKLRKIQFLIVWDNKRSQDFLARYVFSNLYSFKLTCVYCKCSCCMKCASPTEAVMLLVMEGNAALLLLLFGVWSPLNWLHQFKNESIDFYEWLQWMSMWHLIWN